ncbi:MAG: aldehyde dehydrogenase family protein [Oscillospiraceae bacterium]|jgi:succinate-semialdehyde dehydrogenase/glutarate-semialdehyde dehydrogenase|nr:aldehyde dehydrogenase family protein [Oscillospiraceae bacterium]
MYKQYIGGKLAEGRGAVVEVYNPATGELVDSFNGADASQAEEALNAAAKAFKANKFRSMTERISWLAALKAKLVENMDKIIELDKLETGKPHGEAVMDFFMMTGTFDYFMEEVRHVSGESIPDQYGTLGGSYNVVERRPVGVVVAHLAWNYPLLMLSCKLPPAVASGCAVVIKPASDTPLATLFIAQLCAEAGMPDGIVNILAGPSSVLGPVLNGSVIPRLITVIGSAETGKQVMRQGSTSVKSYSLELGGNNPCIIMPDAELEEAAWAIVEYKFTNAGQVCANYNRVFVHADVYDKFLALALDVAKKYKLGSVPEADGDVMMGPMITPEARARALAMIDDAKAKGARVLCGGGIPAGRSAGNWLEPTIVADCADDMRLFAEEIFAPIVAVTSFTDLDDTLQRAINTEYGLYSYLYTHDARVIAKCFETFESGVTVVNNGAGGGNVPHIGIKGSGVLCGTSAYGLDSYYDIHVFRIKT